MEPLNLDAHFVNIFAALAPAFAYVAVYFVRRGIKELPAEVKPLLPLVGPVLGMLGAWVGNQAGESTSVVIAAAWGGLATVVYEVQKSISKAKKARAEKQP